MITSSLRWIAVLPAAVVGHLFIQVFGALCMTMANLPDFYQQCANSIVGGASLVYIGAKVAPCHRFIVAICLAVGFSVVTAIVSTLAIERGMFTIWQIACVVAGVVASIVTAFVIREDLEDAPEPSRVTGWN